MSRRFLARAQASDVREGGCHVTTSHASITVENYRKKQGRRHFFYYLYWVCQYPGCQRFFNQLSARFTLSQVFRERSSGAEQVFQRVPITDSNSIKREGSVLKVDMTKQFVSTV